MIYFLNILEISSFISDLIKKVFQGLFYLVNFIFDFLNYCIDIFSVLPSNIGSILISVITVSFVIIVYKAIHS